MKIWKRLVVRRKVETSRWRQEQQMTEMGSQVWPIPSAETNPQKKKQQKQHTNIKEKKIIKGFPGISTTFTDK